ncbi:hypothetical protein BC628DRAFT_1395572 [Trametes gibbosa]|nr:hypothetical protein BC628DRAFT_1395572 [Trametes gibbosa]
MEERISSRSAYATPHARDQISTTTDRQRAYIRHNILHHHLEQTLRKALNPTDAILFQSLALSAVLHSTSADYDQERRIAGGLTIDDVVKMAPVSLPAPREQFIQKLEDELRSTLLTVVQYLALNDEDDDAWLQAASEVPKRICLQKDELSRQRAALLSHRTQVLRLIDQINLAFPALDAQLTSAFSTLPPHLRATRSAEADVLATTIEAALHKLLLVRARADRALYAFPISATSPPNSHSAASNLNLPSELQRNRNQGYTGGVSRPRADPETLPRAQVASQTISDAVTTAYALLLDRQQAQDEEARSLDGQIAAYERTLGLVEGGRGREGAFAQVVKDMARVKRETEECRRDLKRLGWTEG